jgi:hypothetical protein
MGRRARIAALSLATAAGVLTAAHTALWFWAAGFLEQQVAANLAHGLAPGWRASHGPLSRDGWPLQATVHAPGVEIRQEQGAVSWTAARLSASVSLLRPRTLVVAASGQQSLRFGPNPPVPFSAEKMQAEVPLRPERSLSIAVAALKADLSEGALTLGRLELSLWSQHAARREEPALSVDLTANAIGLPPGPWPLGPQVQQLGLVASVSGPVSPSPDPRERAEAWRDAGGTLSVRSLDIAWGKVTLAGTARLALDAELQPAGDATARIAGYAELLDALVASRMLEARAAMGARAVLGLMARPPAGGGPPVVEVPVALKNRTLSLGRIPLVRVPELVWRPRP